MTLSSALKLISGLQSARQRTQFGGCSFVVGLWFHVQRMHVESICYNLRKREQWNRRSRAAKVPDRTYRPIEARGDLRFEETLYGAIKALVQPVKFRKVLPPTR